MPFREKSAWISLLTTLAVYGVYFARIMPALLAPPGQVEIAGSAATAVLVLIVLQAALHIAAAATAPRDARTPPDERERLIEFRALRIAFYVSQTGAFCAMLALLWRNDAVFVVNTILLAMVAAEIARAGATVAGFRRAAA
jgi:hypothetical protein